MHLVLYLFLLIMLLVIGLRAITGHGLKLTLFRTFHGAAARPLGVLSLAAGLALAAWLALHPDLASILWQGRQQ